jgi:hypothetical protein
VEYGLGRNSLAAAIAALRLGCNGTPLAYTCFMLRILIIDESRARAAELCAAALHRASALPSIRQ